MLTITGRVFCPVTSVLEDKAAYTLVVAATAVSRLWLLNRTATTNL